MTLLTVAALLNHFSQAFLAQCTFSIAILMITVWVVLLLILWSLGCACCRDEGAKLASSATHENMVVNVFQVGNGTVGMSRAPGRKRKGEQRDLHSDIDYIWDTYRFDVIVTLLEGREMEAMQCQDMGRVTMSKGMQWIHFPIRDKWIPSDTSAFLSKVVQPVARLLQEGKRVLIHCNGGKGRTGTVVACLLMTSTALGSSRCRTLSDALLQMRQCRRGMLENPLQQLYMYHIGEVLASI